MALSPVEQVRLLIGDVPSSPFYQLFSDEEIQQFLDMTNQNVFSAARLAAISASFQLAGWSTRERTGDIEVWSSLSTQYLKALDYMINNPGSLIPNGLMPWSASTGSCNKLLNIEICDGDNCREAQACCGTGCGCDECHSQGTTFEYPVI
ncbi:MAG: hypothetical protein PUP93_06680 [Rhizonema sp. NSF051]|nr:hypothetical protein [Rhizonema sp. NSF051]